MRWESLFEDLESQLDAADAAEREARVGELARAEAARFSLADRLRGCSGGELRLRLCDGTDVTGTLTQVAEQWVLLATATAQVLVPAHAAVAVYGMGPRAAGPRSGVEARLSLGHALRALSRDRVAVRVVVAGSALAGRVERVGRDHLELEDRRGAEPGARRGTGLVHGPGPTGRAVVPFTAIVSVTELR